MTLSHFLKHIVTLGFAAGVLSLILRYMDERLSDTRKKRFGVMIDRITLAVDSATPRSIFKWIRENKRIGGKWGKFVGELIFLLLFLIWTSKAVGISHPKTWLTAFLASVIISIFVVMSAVESDKDERWYLILWIATLIVMPVVAIKYVAPKEGMRVALASCAIILGFYIAPYLLLKMFKHLLLKISMLMWWLATYPKGAWAGFIYVATFALGVLRLFI